MVKRNISCVLMVLAILMGSETGWGFTVLNHKLITQHVLDDISAAVDGKQVHATTFAITEINRANAAVDDEVDGKRSEAAFHPERHFTDEKFSLSEAEVNKQTHKVLDMLKKVPPNGAEARKHLGYALHTIQDFYSHTNWVEKNCSEDSPALCLPYPEYLRFPRDPPKSFQPCPDNPNTLGDGGNNYYASGFYIGNLGCDPDFEQDHIGWPPGKGDENFGSYGDGKCLHGNYLQYLDYNNFVLGCPGINKDCKGDCKPITEGLGIEGPIAERLETGIGSSESKYHSAAFSAARKATEFYMLEIFKDIKKENSPPDKANSAILALLGQPPPISFVIDTTASMEPVFEQMKEKIRSILLQAETFMDDELDLPPPFYIFLGFGDTVDTVPQVLDLTNLLAEIDGLSASGGGDCDESSGAALLATVEVATESSIVFLFTNSGPKDTQKMDEANYLASKKNIRVNIILFGACVSNDSDLTNCSKIPQGVYKGTVRWNFAGTVSPFSPFKVEIDETGLVKIVNWEGEIFGSNSTYFPEYNLENHGDGTFTITQFTAQPETIDGSVEIFSSCLGQKVISGSSTVLVELTSKDPPTMDVVFSSGNYNSFAGTASLGQ